MIHELRERFLSLHQNLFVMPNPWDVGSALILESLGFSALATTSSGMAAALGRQDQQTSLDELVTHVASVANAVNVPVNVDAEYCFSQTTAGLVETVDRLADAGASGISIEDYNPLDKTILEQGLASERVAAVVEAAGVHGITVTARSENHLYGVSDLDDTIGRLVAYQQAGADVLYAPGVVEPDAIAQLVSETDRPINILPLPGCPEMSALAQMGVRRISTGGSLAWTAYGALAHYGRSLAEAGSFEYLRHAIRSSDRNSAFGG